jgi:PPOX class probable F420-dependent enzyme
VTSAAGPTPSRRKRGDDVLGDPLVRELLGARLIANLATLDADGTVHLVPMWFARDGRAIVLATGAASAKVRNLERDARATVMLDDSRAGMDVCGVSLTGSIEIVRGGDAVPLVALVHRRYVSEAGLEAPAVRSFLASDDVALRFTPERAVTWDERGSEAQRALAEGGGAYPLRS